MQIQSSISGLFVQFCDDFVTGFEYKKLIVWHDPTAILIEVDE